MNEPLGNSSPTAPATLRLDGRVVIVTGGARGIGRSYVDLLAQRGARIIVNDLGVERDGSSPRAQPAEEFVEVLRARGVEAIASGSDVADPGAAAGLVELAMHRWGRLDALINNAGIFLGVRSFLETTLDDFLQVWRVHLGGTYNMCRAALPPMLAAGTGRIVNSCSIQGLYGAATSADYAAAKGAVQALTRSLAAAVRGSGVAVNAISPGAYTRMVSGDVRDESLNVLLEQALRPELVAPVALWLCHELCTYNGEILQAYAGRVSRTVIGELPGFWDFAPSPESIAAGIGALVADLPILQAADSASMARQIVVEAKRRRDELESPVGSPKQS
jgi:NAD(P)-dependent dehydrogenase (short-subunit alcohol dehydrogenase family)